MTHLIFRLCLLLCPLSSIVASAEDLCILREPLGQSWHNELITVPLSPAQLLALQNQQVLVDQNNRLIPFQIISPDKSPQLAFQTSLQPGETISYRIMPKAAGRQTVSTTAAPRITEQADRIILDNTLVAVTLLKAPRDTQSPLAAFRTPSGQWTENAQLQGTPAILSSRLTITETGPVFVEVRCDVEFTGGGRWNFSCRVSADEPVVLINEQQHLIPDGVLQLPLSAPGFQPTHLLHRHGKGDLGRLDSWPIADGQAFLLEPWLRWWMNERQGNWFALHTADAERMLMIAALRPTAWRQPGSQQGDSQPLQMPAQATAIARNGRLTLDFPMGTGQRRWLAGLPLRQPSVDQLAAKDLKQAPPCQQLLIRHGDFPFDEVRQWVLNWDGDHSNYPRLFLNKASLQELRSALPQQPEEVRRWTSQQPIDKYNIEAPLRAWFSSEDPALEAALIARCEEWLETVIINELLLQHGRPTPGTAPHSQSVLLLPALNLTDAVLSAPGLSPERRQRILTRLAFFGYVVNRDDYWSVARGYAANPNMTTTVSLYRTLAASLIPSHPVARTWADNGLQELRRQLQQWSDQDGGWLEAPHYAMVSLDHMVGAFLMARNNGFGNSIDDPQLKKVFTWLAQISTPPDRRTDGFRHYPNIGHTYHGEGTGMFGIMAGLWRESDPSFAASMQWMFEQHGKQPIGLFGPFATFSGYTRLLLSHNVPAVPMALPSRWFQNTGVVLRSHAGTERESCLTLIAGSNHEHYDNDSGSITVWGLGKILADDFGYVGAQPARFHSLPEWPGIQPESGAPGVMQIKQFRTGTRLDYVYGTRAGWQREIAFLKDPDPSGEVAFLLHDRLEQPPAAVWRLWLTGDRVEFPSMGRATLIGSDGIDLEIFCWPAKTALTTAAATVEGMARRNGREERQPTTQTALETALSSQSPISVLLWPRRKQDPAPRIAWFSNGRGVEIQSDAGTSYLSLPATELQSSPDQQFSSFGAAVAVQLRGTMLHSTLTGRGLFKARGHTESNEGDSLIDTSVSIP
ncbi:MAG TPA: hypothetical protein DIT89_08730 [Planctomycetaceae bacterium]|nr:hypothetical protein [Planctomycetaceae bacterium]